MRFPKRMIAVLLISTAYAAYLLWPSCPQPVVPDRAPTVQTRYVPVPVAFAQQQAPTLAVYYINHPQNTDRRRRLVQLFSGHDLNLTRVWRFTFDSLQDLYPYIERDQAGRRDVDRLIKNKDTTRVLHQLSARLNHVWAAHQFLASGATYGLIMEDDIASILLRNPMELKNRLLGIAQQAPRNWTVLKLTYLEPYTAIVKLQQSVHQVEYVRLQDMQITGAVAYLINRDAARQLVYTLGNDWNPPAGVSPQFCMRLWSGFPQIKADMGLVDAFSWDHIYSMAPPLLASDDQGKSLIAGRRPEQIKEHNSARQRITQWALEVDSSL
jgi:hypothetical protein